MMTIFNTVLLLLSIGALIYTERSHVKLFMSDIGVMAACGAEKKHLFYLFIMEFTITAAISGVIACGLSSLFMYGLLSSVPTTVISSTWVVFKFDLISALMFIAAYFALGLIALISMLSVALKQTSVYLISSTDEGGKVAGRKKRISANDPISAIKSIFVKRTKNIRGTLMIAVPLIATIIAVVGYMTDAVYHEIDVADTHLSIMKYTGYWEYEDISDFDSAYPVYTEGFSDEDAAHIRSIPHVIGVVIEPDEDALREWLFVTLDDAKESGAIYEKLLNRFGGNDYDVTDVVASLEESREYQKLLFMLAMLLFSVFFIVLLIVIYFRITGYVEAQSKNIYILRLIGGEGGDILRAFMRRALHIATAGIVSSCALGYAGYRLIAFLDSASTGYQGAIIINAQSAAILLSVIGLFYAAFLLPMFISVKRLTTADLSKLRG